MGTSLVVILRVYTFIWLRIYVVDTTDGLHNIEHMFLAGRFLIEIPNRSKTRNIHTSWIDPVGTFKCACFIGTRSKRPDPRLSTFTTFRSRSNNIYTKWLRVNDTHYYYCTTIENALVSPCQPVLSYSLDPHFRDHYARYASHNQHQFTVCFPLNTVGLSVIVALVNYYVIVMTFFQVCYVTCRDYRTDKSNNSNQSAKSSCYIINVANNSSNGSSTGINLINLDRQTKPIESSV